MLEEFDAPKGNKTVSVPTAYRKKASIRIMLVYSTQKNCLYITALTIACPSRRKNQEQQIRVHQTVSRVKLGPNALQRFVQFLENRIAPGIGHHQEDATEHLMQMPHGQLAKPEVISGKIQRPGFHLT